VSRAGSLNFLSLLNRYSYNGSTPRNSRNNFFENLDKRIFINIFRLKEGKYLIIASAYIKYV